MFHIFWQRSPFALHFSPAGLSKIAHILPTKYAAIAIKEAGEKNPFASQKNVYRGRQAQAHTEKHI